MNDTPTYCCDRPDCQVPVEITALVKAGREYWCRSCWERHNAPAGRSTNRREGNRLAKSDTRFEDWPGPGIAENES